MSVVPTPEVKEYLNNLVTILYEKGYFGSPPFAKRYVDTLLDDITKNLPAKTHRPAPPYFDRYGKDMEYSVFKKNRRTEWYVFFTTYLENMEEIYLVRYIGNNHTDAHHLY